MNQCPNIGRQMRCVSEANRFYTLVGARMLLANATRNDLRFLAWETATHVNIDCSLSPLYEQRIATLTD